MRSLATACLFAACGFLTATAGCSANRFNYSGTLQTESARVGSTIGGRVVAVLVADGQRVKRNQVIIALDDSDQRAAVAAAVSGQAQAAAALADLEAGPRAQEVARARATEAQARAAFEKAASASPQQLRIASENVRQAQAAASQAQLDYQRARQLFAQGAIAAQALDSARAANATAQARLEAARAQLIETERASLPHDVAIAQRAYEAAAASRALVEAGARPDQILQARAALGAATANVAAAQSHLREMAVRAPANGIVDSLDLHPGDLVGPRVQVAVVRELRDPYVRIYVVQRDLGRMKEGTTVHVRSDAVPGRTFDGSIEQIDQDAQFTPRDVQTAEDRAGLVYGVKVRVHDPSSLLHGGTTAEVSLE
ncbi:MAG: efflux RND transporter periplasmic adaptor subunit [Candidatus Eremiobacteraeota bacterium]|nr:efflux RND transporter periplasmic adaptor subunit [Candidatus Eremiobacteraeota bacterium]